MDEYRKRKTISLEVLLEKGFEPSSMDAEGFFRKFDEKSTVKVCLLNHIRTYFQNK